MKIAESGNVLFNELALLSDPQSALLLLIKTLSCHSTELFGKVSVSSATKTGS